MTVNGSGEWWEEVFSDKEAESLIEASENILDDTDEDEQGVAYMEIVIMLPETKIASTLQGIRRSLLFTPVDSLFKEFLTLLGESIAIEYLHGDLTPDEVTTDEAQHFLPEIE